MEWPHLQPKYDDPEFLGRATYHFYAGWLDGNPARLKPAPDSDIASEFARLAGGADKIAQRVDELAHNDQVRLAAHLAELASTAEPENKSSQSIRTSALQKSIDGESPLMAKAFYAVYLWDA